MLSSFIIKLDMELTMSISEQAANCNCPSKTETEPSPKQPVEILPEKRFINRIRQEFLTLPFFLLNKPISEYIYYDDKKKNISYKSHVGFDIGCLKVFMFMNEMAYLQGQKYSTFKTLISTTCFGGDGSKELARVENALSYINSFHIEAEFTEKSKKFWRNLIFTDSIFFEDEKNKTGRLDIVINSEYYNNIIKSNTQIINVNIKNLNKIKGNNDNQRRLFLYLSAFNNIEKIAIETIFWKANISNAQYDKNMTDEQCNNAVRKFKYNLLSGKYNEVLGYIEEQKNCLIRFDKKKEFLLFIKKIDK